MRARIECKRERPQFASITRPWWASGIGTKAFDFRLTPLINRSREFVRPAIGFYEGSFLELGIRVVRAEDRRSVERKDSARRVGHMAFYCDHLMGGGGQKVPLMLAKEFVRRGYRADLVVCRIEGELIDEVPEEVNLVELQPTGMLTAKAYALASDPRGFPHVTDSRSLRYLPDLVRYLQREKPDILFSARPYMNVEACLANRLARGATRVIVGEYNQLSMSPALATWFRRRFLPPVLRRAYLSADAIVALSDGVADDLATVTGLPRKRITIVPPPVQPELPELAQEPANHPWLQNGKPPVLLGVGRLTGAKDFPTLVRAFARVRQQRPARLLILGNTATQEKTAERQGELMRLADELGVAEDVHLAGYVRNPFRYMAHAAVFVLSSITEGFGMVVAEALACGCPVVSTDCPSGPAEILGQGRYGKLVPVGDDAALAQAIIETLQSPPDSGMLRARSAAFSLERCAERYEDIMGEWLNRTERHRSDRAARPQPEVRADTGFGSKPGQAITTRR